MRHSASMGSIFFVGITSIFYHFGSNLNKVAPFWPNWHQVSIGIGNGLAPHGAKPLPKTTLANITNAYVVHHSRERCSSLRPRLDPDNVYSTKNGTTRIISGSHRNCGQVIYPWREHRSHAVAENPRSIHESHFQRRAGLYAVRQRGSDVCPL